MMIRSDTSNRLFNHSILRLIDVGIGSPLVGMAGSLVGMVSILVSVRGPFPPPKRDMNAGRTELSMIAVKKKIIL